MDNKELELKIPKKRNRLSLTEKNLVIAALCEGKSVKEVIQIVKDNYNKDLNRADINYYKRQYKEDILTGRQELLEDIKSYRLALIYHRIDKLEGLLFNCFDNLENKDDWKVEDLTKIMAMLQNHLGELGVGDSKQVEVKVAVPTVIQIPSFGEDDPIND